MEHRHVVLMGPSHHTLQWKAHTNVWWIRPLGHHVAVLRYHLLIFPHGSYHRDPIRKTLPFKTNGNRLMHSADCFPLGQGFQVLSFDNNSECLRFGEL